MNKLNLTTRLNIKIICIVTLLMIVVTAYTHWLSLQDENNEYTKQLESITAYLIKKKPAGSFVELANKENTSAQKQVLAVNKKLQPILEDIFMPSDIIKFGYYSRDYERVVAIGPVFDSSLLIGVDPSHFSDIYQTNTTRLGKKENSIVWYGAPILYHLRPISENGVIIGHAFASINMNAVYAKIWNRTLYTFLGAFIMSMICIIIFQDVFIKLKKDLKLFAEEILKGRSNHFESEIAELNPILKYISKQTEEMTRLDRLNIIGEMAASIGHEVRNPMTTVRGLLQFMGNKDELKAYHNNFTLMIDELDRANNIITEFLSLAKNKNMDFKESSLNKVINGLSPLLQADAFRNNCQIVLKLQDVPNIRMDERSIRQLILNMVRNALEAMPNGGTIEISTVNYEQQTHLTIKDEGFGIPDEILDKIGTPFFTTKENGTGLGLAVCYRIVQRHNAHMFIDSNPGKGTVFTITFIHA